MSEQLALGVPGPKAWWKRLFREPARPDWVRRRPSAPWLVVATVCIGAFMGQLDASIVTLAIPSIKTDMNASLAQVEWVALIYLLVLVGSISAIGRLADMLGRKLLYTYGFGLFTLASLGCALAPDITWLLVARAIQAVGAAMLQANSVALIRTSMPAGKLGKAIGLQGAAQAVGLAMGPSVGGLLVGAGGWRWVFYVNIPAGIIGLVLGWFLLPRTHVKAPKVRLDWAGLLLLMPATGALLLALSEASRLGFANPLVAALLSASLVLFTAFVLWERRAPHPLVDMGLFRAGTFSRGITTGLLSYLVLFGVLFVTPLYLEAAHSMPPVQAGLLLTILPIGLALIAPVAGTLADRLGARVPTTVGMALAAASLAVLAFSGGNLWLAGSALGGIGVGLGLFTPANNATVAAAGHTHQAGMVSGVMNMTRGVGTSLGVAFGAVLYVLASGTATTGGRAPASTAGFELAITVFAATALLAAILAVSGKRQAGS
ncbi:MULTISPECIES: DHA2 family efflux MFS transporter permease subunit [Arthrobacter]|jgi:EmrB/QacA subfamily drug resistance transporter|uniref:DHA2 family efflux MFS transporter permease subunit n=1 Tax=Arthrobacter wenxiniae TaxID=2713570 RepID=A0A7Y7IJS4_9MICC|nr:MULTISPECIES: DHA2 family efflux MFS transporter permease subunit [Arthrobacter]MCU6479545.1 DHA2 family efflux MFS transporter permease subunit [Arthrobacter sp. A2-55]NVM96756.1 DHA2 family efflux MFS transporter permease subunit [Arthrobacter wenxiniae]